MYGLVCINWNGKEVYTSFFSDPEKAIEKAKIMNGVIRVEKAHSGEDPIWICEKEF